MRSRSSPCFFLVFSALLPDADTEVFRKQWLLCGGRRYFFLQKLFFFSAEEEGGGEDHRMMKMRYTFSSLKNSKNESKSAREWERGIPKNFLIQSLLLYFFSQNEKGSGCIDCKVELCKRGLIKLLHFCFHTFCLAVCFLLSNGDKNPGMSRRWWW